MKTEISVQCFGLGTEMAQDLPGTIRKLREIGFDGIEPMIVLSKKQGMMPKQFWTFELLEKMLPVLAECGLHIPSTHVGIGFGLVRKNAKQIIEGIHHIYFLSGIENYVFSGMFSNAKDAKKWGILLHEVAEGIRDIGGQVIYHNHDTEFQEIEADGKKTTALDYFFEFAGSEVLLQLDIGWARFAGDELELAEKYADRIVEIHCKDFYETALRGNVNRDKILPGQFSAIGEGVVKTAEILVMAEKFPHFNGNVIIDQDKSGGSMLEDVIKGYNHLAEWLGR